jgi:hypothetical protein
MIPKTTEPLAKFIRTGEGILVFALNIALLIVPIISNALTPDQSAKWAALIDGITVVSRTGLKAVAASAQIKASAQPAAVAAAGQPAVAPAAATPALQSATRAVSALSEFASVTTKLPATLSADLADVERLVSDADEFADAPSGTRPTANLVGARQPPTQPFRVRLGEDLQR